MPIVSAQILAGMIVGPYVLGWVVDQSVISEISSIEIVLLLFIIGLELDPLELRRLARQVVTLTFIEVVIAFLFGLAAAYLVGLTSLESIIVAMAACISSTAIVGKIILERRMFQAKASSILVGLMITEDILAVAFLIVLSILGSNAPATSDAQITRIFVVGLGGVGLVVVGYLVARYFAPYAINYLSSYELESEEIPFLFALALGLLFAVFAGTLGYSPGIGAFVIGLSIRGKQSKFLSAKVTTIKDLFLVLFFVSMGSLIDPFSALSLGLAVILALVLIVVGKLVGGWLIGRISSRGSDLNSGNDPAGSLAFASWLVPRGEFSFVIGQFALAAGLVDKAVFSLVGLAVLVSALAGPLIQRFVEPRLATTAHLLEPHVDSRTE